MKNKIKFFKDRLKKLDYKCQEVWVDNTNPKSNLMERELVIIKIIKIKLISYRRSDFYIYQVICGQLE